MDDMARKDEWGKENSCETYEESRLGGKLHRTFMAKVGEEMSQTEVAHHANKCPEYFCSRPEKTVHMYKKALALDVGPRKRKARLRLGTTAATMRRPRLLGAPRLNLGRRRAENV